MAECLEQELQEIANTSTAKIIPKTEYLAALLSWVDIEPSQQPTEWLFDVYASPAQLGLHNLRNRVIEHKQQWGASQLHLGDSDEYTEDLAAWFTIDSLQKQLEEQLGDVPPLRFKFDLFAGGYRLLMSKDAVLSPLHELDLCDVQAIKKVWDTSASIAYLRLTMPTQT